MHVPDGFLAPRFYLPLWAALLPAWIVALRRLRRRLDERTLPRLAAATAVAFALSSVALPLPGGTSVHASGVGLLATVFGPAAAFASLSLVFLIQALVLGQGGITALPLGALALGLVGGSVAAGLHRLLGRRLPRTALFLAGAGGTLAAAAVVALALGLQPALAHRPDGTPLFFPFGLGVTLPALLLPHLVVGAAEGVLTVLAWRAFRGRATGATP